MPFLAQALRQYHAFGGRLGDDRVALRGVYAVPFCKKPPPLLRVLAEFASPSEEASLSSRQLDEVFDKVRSGDAAIVRARQLLPVCVERAPLRQKIFP
jgi:hypothetical protein